MSHNKWPHELEDYPISCSKCQYSEQLGDRYIGCTQKDIVLMKGSQLKKCDWYRKRGDALHYAEKADPTTKPPHLVKRCESTKEEPHTDAGRNQTVDEAIFADYNKHLGDQQ